MKKIAALALAVGLCTPYSCDVRPVEFLWGDWQGVVSVGIPVLGVVAYLLHAFLGAFTRLIGRHGGAVQRLLLGVYAALLAFWVIACALDGMSLEQWAWLMLAAVFTLGLLIFARRAGAPATRVPPLLLVLVGIPAVYFFLSELRHLRAGGWIFSAGYALAVILEARDLRKTPPGEGVAPP